MRFSIIDSAHLASSDAKIISFTSVAVMNMCASVETQKQSKAALRRRYSENNLNHFDPGLGSKLRTKLFAAEENHGAFASAKQF
jgi:hypothetical protein